MAASASDASVDGKSYIVGSVLRVFAVSKESHHALFTAALPSGIAVYGSVMPHFHSRLRSPRYICTLVVYRLYTSFPLTVFTGSAAVVYAVYIGHHPYLTSTSNLGGRSRFGLTPIVLRSVPIAVRSQYDRTAIAMRLGVVEGKGYI